MSKTTHTARFGAGLSRRQLAGVILLPLVLFFAGLCIGRMALSPMDVAGALLSKLGVPCTVSAQANIVVWSMRLPRLVLAVLVGAGLSVSGCTYQSVFSNPLATPDTLGVASGASFGAAAALLLGWNGVGVQLLALVFGLLAVLLTGVVGRGLGSSKSTPILAGIMMGSLFSSLVSFVKFTADTESQLPSITYWLMGSLEQADGGMLLLGGVPILAGMVVLLLIRWRMNLLVLTEDEAVSAGVNIKRLRMVSQLCATVITASCVSMCGQVGWVGLLVPHICRMRYGSNNVALLPACVGWGAAFLLAVDTIARTVSAKEIPISVLTAMIGAPFFIYLLRKNRGWSL